MNFYVSFLNNIALKIVANNIKYVWQPRVFLSFNTKLLLNAFLFLSSFLFLFDAKP